MAAKRMEEDGDRVTRRPMPDATKGNPVEISDSSDKPEKSERSERSLWASLRSERSFWPSLRSERTVQSSSVRSERSWSENQTQSWFQTATRLERKAQSQKNKGDIVGAIESLKVVLDFRRASLAKRVESGRHVSKTKQEVARTLVGLAHLVLIIDETKEAEAFFKEAVELYKASGLSKNEDCMLEINRELDRLRWKNKRGLPSCHKSSRAI